VDIPTVLSWLVRRLVRSYGKESTPEIKNCICGDDDPGHKLFFQKESCAPAHVTSPYLKPFHFKITPNRNFT
jgi:hypothetical protein